MPRSYPTQLLSLIQSTSYPPTPSLQELELLKQQLTDHTAYITRSSTSTAVYKSRDRDGSVDPQIQLQAKKKKRKEREDEREALEANEKAAAKLEVLERARVAAIQGHGHGHGQKQKPNQKFHNGHAQGQGHGSKSRQGTVGAAGTASPSGIRVKKERTSLSPAPSNASSASFRPNLNHAAPTTYGGQQMKKKKVVKRVLDSDDEALSQRDRSTTLASPPPHHSHSHHQSSTSGLKLKLSHTHPSHPSNQKHHRPTDPSPTPSASAISNNIDFSLPPAPARPLVPPRPGVQKPPKPGPKKQSEVDEDFSNAKAPSQVAFPTFWSGVEPYVRDIREDDLAMLGFKADAPESYEIPPRGRHYTEIWDEEDGNPLGTTSRFPVPNLRLQQQSNGTSQGALPLPHFVPSSELRDENLVDEHRGLGSLTERVVAAVVGKFGFGTDKKVEEKKTLPPTPDIEYKDPAKVDVVELEERMKKELKAVMLLGEHDEYDSNNRDDDEITSALRQCQRQLVQQTALNDARRSRLAEIAKHRLAYTEYTSALEGIEKSIETNWAKRIKKYGTTPKKSSSSSSSGGSGRPPVPDNLKRFVGTRQHWIETVGKLMSDRPQGQVCGIPTESVYTGIGEERDEKDEETVEEAVDVDADVDVDVDDNEIEQSQEQEQVMDVDD